MSKIDRELMRGVGPLAVLKLLESGEKYGYELVEDLSTRGKGVLAMGQSTLYPLLYNLEAQGLIKGTWREAQSGRDRKYYALTDAGKRRLAADSEQFRRLTDAFEQLGVLGPATQAVRALVLAGGVKS